MEKLSESMQIRCQWCGAESAAKDWNDGSFEACITREMRRAFKDIYNKVVWGSKSKNYYMCPNCKMWVKGNQLVGIDDNGDIIKGIGGKPIIRVRDSSNKPVY